MALGIWALYVRPQFRWTTMEATQLVFGLSIPLLILSHLIGVRLASPLPATSEIRHSIGQNISSPAQSLCRTKPANTGKKQYLVNMFVDLRGRPSAAA